MEVSTSAEKGKSNGPVVSGNIPKENNIEQHPAPDFKKGTGTFSISFSLSCSNFVALQVGQCLGSGLEVLGKDGSEWMVCTSLHVQTSAIDCGSEGLSRLMRFGTRCCGYQSSRCDGLDTLYRYISLLLANVYGLDDLTLVCELLNGG